MKLTFRFPRTKLHGFSILMVVTALAGCGHSAASDMVQPPDLKSTDHYQVLIREARAEADMLRSELAALKIATAKQNAELQSAQRSRTSLCGKEKMNWRRNFNRSRRMCQTCRRSVISSVVKTPISKHAWPQYPNFDN